MTATAPSLTEREFMQQVIQLAEIRGWQWLHIRPGMTRESWRTPISGPLGKGWPDLLLIRPRDGRRLAIELKRDGAKPTDEQAHVARLLAECGIDARWFDPAHWDDLEEVLR